MCRPKAGTRSAQATEEEGDRQTEAQTTPVASVGQPERQGTVTNMIIVLLLISVKMLASTLLYSKVKYA